MNGIDLLIDPVEVEARDGYSIWLRFEDGVEGELDISHWIEKPYFAPLLDREVFESVHISDHGSISWGFPNGYGYNGDGMGMEVDTCAESSYARLLGISLNDIQTMDWDEFYGAVEKAHEEYHSAVMT